MSDVRPAIEPTLLVIMEAIYPAQLQPSWVTMRTGPVKGFDPTLPALKFRDSKMDVSEFTERDPTWHIRHCFGQLFTRIPHRIDTESRIS
jgi:hypothetical protein